VKLIDYISRTIGDKYIEVYSFEEKAVPKSLYKGLIRDLPFDDLGKSEVRHFGLIKSPYPGLFIMVSPVEEEISK